MYQQETLCTASWRQTANPVCVVALSSPSPRRNMARFRGSAAVWLFVAAWVLVAGTAAAAPGAVPQQPTEQARQALGQAWDTCQAEGAGAEGCGVNLAQLRSARLQHNDTAAVAGAGSAASAGTTCWAAGRVATPSRKKPARGQ